MVSLSRGDREAGKANSENTILRTAIGFLSPKEKIPGSSEYSTLIKF